MKELEKNLREEINWKEEKYKRMRQNPTEEYDFQLLFSLFVFKWYTFYCKDYLGGGDWVCSIFCALTFESFITSSDTIQPILTISGLCYLQKNYLRSI